MAWDCTDIFACICDLFLPSLEDFLWARAVYFVNPTAFYTVHSAVNIFGWMKDLSLVLRDRQH